MLRRAPLSAFPAVVDAQGVPDPYNADVVVIIDRTPPAPANATYAGAAQAVGGAGNFLVPAGVCADAVSSSPALLAVVRVDFVASDGLGYHCPVPAPLAGAHCLAPTVRGPAQDLVLAVTCADEAGNSAVGYVTVPIVAAGACAAAPPVLPFARAAPSSRPHARPTFPLPPPSHAQSCRRCCSPTRAARSSARRRRRWRSRRAAPRR